MKDAERRAALADNAYEHRKQAERFVEEGVEKITRRRVGAQKNKRRRNSQRKGVKEEENSARL
jgi:hypothetical protein